MIPELRKQFLEQWSPERYAEMLAQLDADIGKHVGFRISETPVFYPRALLEKMARYGQELYAQIAGNEEYRAASERTIPSRFRVPDEAEHPLFVQADFGLVQSGNGELEPKLVEMQGFPSIFALQCATAEAYAETYGIHRQHLLGGLDKSSFVELFKKAVLGGHDPEDVVLLEVDPENQKTAADFYETRRLLGLRICPLHEVKKQGRKLMFQGRRIKRIFNRVIADEMFRKDVKFDFEFTDRLDVEWAGHPSWFFRLSKFSLPWFRHECVPATQFLSEVKELPAKLDDYVLKPLFSFGGQGVKVGPTRAEVEAIPVGERGDYILQQRMEFARPLETPRGSTAVETRILYIRDGGALRPVATVVRTGRGKMMGVAYNRDLDWVGASAAFYSGEA